MSARALLLAAAVAALAGGAALAVLGPRRGLGVLADAARRAAPELVGGAALLAAALALAASEVDVLRRGAQALAGLGAFAALWLLAWALDPQLRPLAARAARLPVAVVALACAALAWAAHHLVLGGIPHVSDEVAYLFQAKALAQGRLGVPPPPDWEVFGFLHTRVQDGVWHGIMNPGWPGVLAPGVAAGVPGLVNPVLAALGVLGLHRFLRRSGASSSLAGLTALALAVSPFFVFLAGTFMAHTASLALFVAFLLAWRRILDGGGLAASLAAGAALAGGILVRPLDAVVTAVPFGLCLAWGALRDARLRVATLVVGGVAAGGIALVMAYNAALTGDPLVFVQTLYFEEQTPGQRFGIGFGDDMGTRIHGEEWPGYHPGDAPRVTGHRLAVGLQDVHGLALLTAAALVYALRRRARAPGLRELLVASGLLVLVYGAHFYHGIAYGARHYFLALPALALATAWPLAEGLARGGEAARRARAAVAAGLAAVALVAVPPLVAEYGDRYRMATPALRDAVHEAGLHRALVLVDPAHWAWKSAFPLNDHPLERSDVLFAQDPGGDAARDLIRRHPDRRPWRAHLHPHEGVSLEPLAPAPGSRDDPGAGRAP